MTYSATKFGCYKRETGGWYLWRRTVPKKGTGVGSGSWLVISAHGGELPGVVAPAKTVLTGLFRPKFHFFSLKGTSVTAQNLGLFVKSARTMVDNAVTYYPAKNYEAQDEPFEFDLAKFQGSHGGDFETYASIQQDIVTQASSGNEYDVLTIRHRKVGKYKGGVKFYEVLRWLKAEQLNYGNIVCSFCRYTGFTPSIGAQ